MVPYLLDGVAGDISRILSNFIGGLAAACEMSLAVLAIVPRTAGRAL